MFNPALLFKNLNLFPAFDVYYVALSGGLDSCALLHALANQPTQLNLRALHINHQLQAQANDWVKFCEKFCQELKIPLDIINVDIQLQPGDSIEAIAREKRYQVFKNLLKQNQAILTAHHQDDQAETLLLQLLRGAGVAGLAAMPKISNLGQGYLVRPLLDFTRESLEQYGIQQNLVWINDPMNADLRFDRNFVRQKIMPILQQRWPKASETIARSAAHCAKTHTVINELLLPELNAIKGKDAHSLSIAKLKQHSLVVQYELIRLWLKSQNFALPSTKHLHQLYQDVVLAKHDAEPVMKWEKVEVRRYRDNLYVISPLSNTVVSEVLKWNVSQLFELPNQLGSLKANRMVGEGVKLSLIKNELEIRFRVGGEFLKLPNRDGTRSLKNLWQEWGVPPWLRDRIPLLFHDDQLIAVVGYAIAEDYVAKEGEEGWVIDFSVDYALSR